MSCPNPNCQRPAFLGHANPFDCYARLANSMAIWSHGLTKRYYQSGYCCDEPSCGLVTRQLSVVGAICLRMGCPGTMQPLSTERSVHTHLKYLERLVCVEHAGAGDERNVLSKHEKAAFDSLHKLAVSSVK